MIPSPVFRISRGMTGLAVPGLALLALLVAACGSEDPPAGPSTPARLQVVTTTALLADFARNVGRDRVEVSSIVPPGADVHSFQSTPGDSVLIGRAALVVSNGKGLDTFLEPLLDGARDVGTVHLVAAEGLDAAPVRTMGFAGPEVNVAKGTAVGRDPHLWHDPLHAIRYVERIRDELVRVDPAGAEVYRWNASEYIQRLQDLDREVADLLGAVPEHRRHLVTFHDAFGYLAERYGWSISAFVAGDASDVTPGAVVEVLERIKAQGIPAVFAEPQFGADVLEQAARDAGVRVGNIYSDALDSEVTSYIEMMRYNARSLKELLGGPG